MRTVHTLQGLAVTLVLLSDPLETFAAIIGKTNNNDNLNLESSWSGGVVPGKGDIAQWGSTVTDANAVALGADLSWAGFRIVNPGGPVTPAEWGE